MEESVHSNGSNLKDWVVTPLSYLELQNCNISDIFYEFGYILILTHTEKSEHLHSLALSHSLQIFSIMTEIANFRSLDGGTTLRVPLVDAFSCNGQDVRIILAPNFLLSDVRVI